MHDGRSMASSLFGSLFPQSNLNLMGVFLLADGIILTASLVCLVSSVLRNRLVIQVELFLIL